MTDKQFRIFAALGLLVAGGMAYVNTFDGDWVWDDASSVLRHEHVRSPGMFFQLFREDQHPFGKGQGNFYRPLVAASFMLDYALSYDPQADAPITTSHPDVKPLLFHLSNLLWHNAAAILLLLLLLRMDAPRWVASLVPLLFVLHPLHTEAVAYISGRADMMSGAFMFAGLTLCLSEARLPRRYVNWGAGLICFVAALLSKESSMIFPVLLAVLVFLRPRPVLVGETLRGYYGRQAAPLGLAGVVLAVYGALRATVLHFGDDAASVAAPLGDRLLQTGQAFLFYLQKLFWPTHLHMEQTLAGAPAWTGILGWVLIVAVLGGLVAARRAGQHRIVMGLAWFLAAWLPISGIFPLNAPMAEHWMYVPMAGFWWAVCELLWLGASQPRVRPVYTGSVVGLCLIFLGLTVQRNEDWHSNERLFRATLRENPESLRVQFNLAVTYEDLVGNLPGARRHFEKVLATYQAQKRASSLSGDTNYLLEDEIEVRLSLGRLCLEMGDYAEATEHFGLLVNGLAPEKYGALAAEAAIGLGRSLVALGDYAGASNVLGRAATLDPSREPEARALLLEGAPPANLS